MLAACAALTAVVDPFFHYHAPLKGFPYVVDNQLTQNPGMAQHMSYDSCIIGSSMTVNFHTTDFAELLGLNTVKLSYSGAYPKDDDNILKIVFDESTKARQEQAVKAVIMPVDPSTYTAGTEVTKYPLPEYLYDHNPLNDAPYLWNRDVLLQYVLRPMINRKPTDLSTVYASWWTPDYYNEQWVLHGYEPPEKVEEEMPAETLIPGTKDNLEANILPWIESHPETTFYLFYPPYSILYWNDAVTENRLEATLRQDAYLAERFLAYDNVRLFYFQDIPETVTDLNNYADYTHYKPEINRWMVEQFASGGGEVHSMQEMQTHLNHMRSIVEETDLEAILARKN